MTEVFEVNILLLTERKPRWTVLCTLASKIGCKTETHRSWVNKMEVDSGKRLDTPSDDLARLNAFER